MKRLKEQQELPPGPRALPFVGNIFDFRRDQLAFLERMYRTYGPIVTIYLGKQPLFLVFRPEYVRYMLTENGRNFSPPQNPSGDMARMFGRGLLSMEGEEHRQQRRLVQPAFHKKRVESYAAIIVQETLEMLDTWQEGKVLDIAEAMQQLTLRVITHSLFNCQLASEAIWLGNLFTQMVEHQRSPLARLLNLYVDLPFTNYGRRMAAKRKIDTFIYRLIAERRASGRDEGDVLSMLLQPEGDLSLNDTQIRDHVITLMTAGHETATDALTWTFYLLSQNQQAREKLLIELQTVLGGRAPVVDDLPQLPYTQWVINEALRLYPPIWTIARRAINAFDLGNYHFPAGSVFILSQRVLHRHQESWSEPETFGPERWDTENGQKVVQGAYFPFGAGIRICIGMSFALLESQLILTTIIQHYLPRLVPDFQVEAEVRTTLRTKSGLHMILDRTPAITRNAV